jgi:acyl carrier protein
MDWRYLMPSVENQVEEIIRDVSGFEDKIDKEWDLVSKKIIKSVMLLEIISIIEEDFDLDVTAQDIYDGHFVSIKSIKKFIKSNLS